MSRIRSATIVILLTPSSGSSGKSSADDYRDFEEICIEEPTPPEDSDDSESFDVDSEELTQQQHQTTTSTHKQDLLEMISQRALAAAHRSPRVVVRYVTQSPRDCLNHEALVQKLVAGGALRGKITVVRLAMDHNSPQHRNGSFYRTQYRTWRPQSKTLLA